MKPELIDFVEKFKGKRILIIGDMIADIYLKGDISRISREAPVLVLIESEEKTVAGGAAARRRDRPAVLAFEAELRPGGKES